MKLCDVIRDLHKLNDEETVFIKTDHPLSPDTEAKIVFLDEEDDEEVIPEEVGGMKCFMDVWHIKEVINGKSMLNKIDSPTLDQKIEFIINYARNGA